MIKPKKKTFKTVYLYHMCVEYIVNGITRPILWLVRLTRQTVTQ